MNRNQGIFVSILIFIAALAISFPFVPVITVGIICIIFLTLLIGTGIVGIIAFLYMIYEDLAD